MTPKEKAKHLFDRMMSIKSFSTRPIDLASSQAKLAAIITIDEILSCGFNQMHKPEYAAFMVADKFTRAEPIEEEYLSGYEMQDYWEEVKKEIELI